MFKKIKNTLLPLALASLFTILPSSNARSSDFEHNISSSVANKIIGNGGGLVAENPSAQISLTESKGNISGTIWTSYDMMRDTTNETDFYLNYNKSISEYLNLNVAGKIFFLPHKDNCGEVGLTLSTKKITPKFDVYLGHAESKKSQGEIAKVSGSIPLKMGEKINLFVQGDVIGKHKYYGSETGISHGRIIGGINYNVGDEVNVSLKGLYQFPLNKDKFPIKKDSSLELSVSRHF